MTSPTVSVVITCYNLARYVGDAIRSALQQNEDFKSRIELIVVDDCSTDRSAEVIRSFTEAQYVRTPANRGVLLAMLTGAEVATCDLMFFLDGDDIWERHKLAKCVEAFDANSRLGFVTHDLRYVGPRGEPLQRRSRVESVLGSSHALAENVSDKLRHGILSLGDYIWLGSAMGIRRSVVDFDGFAEWALSLADAENTYQDWPLAYWIAAQTEIELAYIPEKMFRYRLHGLNHSGDASTPDRALRNLTRTLNTNLAMAEIARDRAIPERYQRVLANRISTNRYLVDLTSGRQVRALAGFIRSAPDFQRRGLLGKELLRLAAVQLLGPKRAAHFASRRRIMRDLPPT